METLSQFNFLELLILIMLALLFVRETATSFFRKLFNLEKEEDVPAWGERLIQYANHDTTAHIAGIQKSMDELKNFQSIGNITLTEIKNNLENIDKYGVKMRK